MDLPLDLWGIIFDVSLIHSKRMLMQSCKTMLVHFASGMETAKKAFREIINEANFVGHWKFEDFDKLQQLTIESLYSGYMPPENYLIEDNYVLHRNPTLYCSIATRGDLYLLKQMMRFVYDNDLSHMINNIWSDMCCGAMYGGYIDIYEWIDKNAPINAIDYQLSIISAVKGGQLHMLELMYHRFSDFDVDMSDIKINLFGVAAAYGHLHIIEFLLAAGFSCDYQMCSDLIAIDQFYNAGPVTLQNKMNVLEWMIKRDPNKLIICDHLAGMENLSSFNKALDQGYKCSNNVCFFAARSNKFDNLKQCYADGYKLNNVVFYVALETGNIEMLEWLLERMPGYQLSEKDCSNAASYGQFEVVKWLRKINCPWNTEVLKFCFNDINMLRYALENGLIVSDRICHIAIDHENINMLNLLRKYHTWSPKLDDYITYTKHKGMIAWAKSFNCSKK